MHTYLRHALPVTLVGGGLALAVTGIVLGAGQQTLPGSLLLVLTGAAGELYLHLNRPRHAPSAPRDLPPPALRAAPAVPVAHARRSTPGPGIPTPRTARAAGPAADEVLGGPALRRPVERPGGTQRADVRHRVLPHGDLPHQRRASDGS